MQHVHALFDLIGTKKEHCSEAATEIRIQIESAQNVIRRTGNILKI